MRFWVGGYGPDAGGEADGIGVLRAGAADAPLAGGDLAFTGLAAAAASPSWIAAHPTREVLYVAQEAAGSVRAYVRTGEESYTPLGDARAAGAAVCHTAVAPDGRTLVASCWGDGRVVSFPLAADGRIGQARIAPAAIDPWAGTEAGDPVDDALALADIAGFGDLPLFGVPSPTRPPAPSSARVDAVMVPEAAAAVERVSRAHQAAFLPGGVLATTDLGFDLVRFWTVSDGTLTEAQSVSLPRGSGPRHLAWHPSGHLYVVTELSLEVFVLAPDADAPLSRRWRVVSGSSLGAGTAVGADAAAEIALTRGASAVLVGVRGSDTLATLRVAGAGERVVPVALVEAGAAWPRHHAIERDTVLVAGQHAHEVVSLGLDERTGIPGRVRRRTPVPSPSVLVADRSGRP